MTNEILIDEFNRIKDVVHKTVKGLSDDDLTYFLEEVPNSVAWQVWHLTRIQDNHIASFLNLEQVWTGSGWYEKFGLPFDKNATGWGQTAKETKQVKVNGKLLLGYLDEVTDVTVKCINSLADSDYKKIVDKHWDPPVTLAVRLVSVLSDDFQHAGQAAFLKGLIKN
jgi:hypothetical protein